MRLNYIVPTLGLLAASATPVAMAADVGGGLTINGYVDTILELTSLDEGIAPASPVDPTAEDDTIIDFSAAPQLEIGYRIGEDITANVELYWPDFGASAGVTFPVVEQAKIMWQTSDTVSVTIGRMHNHLGLEGKDAPELFRVNNSILFGDGNAGTDHGGVSFVGNDVTGIGVGIKASDQVSVGIYLVDSYYDDVFDAEDGLDDLKEQADFAVGVGIDFKVEGIGSFAANLAYDIAASISDDATDSGDVLAFEVNGIIDMLREDQGLLFGFDLIYRDIDWASSYGLMLMANYDFKTDTPMAATFMLTYVEPNDTEAGDPTGGHAAGDDDENMEIAIALLTQPTRDANFGLNLELRYISRGDLGLAGPAADRNEIGIFAEALAVIP